MEFMTKKVDVTITSKNESGEEVEEIKQFDYAALALDTSIAMQGLTVTDTRTNNKGEVTLTCVANATQIKIFLGLMYDNDGNVVKASEFAGKTINVKGLVDKYYENYQIRVLTYADIVAQ